MSDARVFAVASGKGGVGKTTTAVALGACAAATDRSTVVVDADLGMADLGTVLDLDTEDSATLHDVLAGDADPEDAIRPAPGGFDALPAGVPLDDYATADPAGLRAVVETLRATYDVVVIDVGAGLSHETVVPLGLADGTVLVTTPDAVAIVDAGKIAEIVDRIDGDLLGTVLTRADASDARAFDRPVLGAVPTDDAVPAAAAAGVPVPVHAPDGPAARAYAAIAADLLDVPVAATGIEPDAEADDAETDDAETEERAAADRDAVETVPFADPADGNTTDADEPVVDDVAALIEDADGSGATDDPTRDDTPGSGDDATDAGGDDPTSADSGDAVAGDAPDDGTDRPAAEPDGSAGRSEPIRAAAEGDDAHAADEHDENPEPDATDRADAGESGAAAAASADADEEGDADPSLLSRLTGGRLGAKRE